MQFVKWHVTLEKQIGINHTFYVNNIIISLIVHILYWYGQVVWTPELGDYLYVCFCVSEVMTPLFGVTQSNVELRNHVISRQNFIK